MTVGHRNPDLKCKPWNYIRFTPHIRFYGGWRGWTDSTVLPMLQTKSEETTFLRKFSLPIPCSGLKKMGTALFRPESSFIVRKIPEKRD
jgi:hypothetical protein